MKERLQKIIATAGLASRRRAEKLITEGRVSVNNVIITRLGEKADTQKDVIRVDDRIISTERTKYYIALNKPAGFVTTLHDPQKRPTIVDLLNGVPERVYPVGRLDYNSRGLLILTNDGNFAQRIQHPRFQKSKLYKVKIQGHLSKEQIKQLTKGIKAGDDFFKPENLRVEKVNDQSCWLRLTLREGKNRIVRRGFEAIGCRVAHLVREAIGDLGLESLKEGEWRHLTRKEIGQLLDNRDRQKR
ncbi:MAG: rRNA pseudouridine synthase [Syntrophaceae bacterium]|nr:rRNA pseudouridine synthase [Syntrophaceae bacterium]